ncbi:MAG: winged helix-turn-helix transcriptional regulator [Spirochaetales bacterium]|jgi:ArsR family transcriptional regulator, arsenate/arsenite/antimonite-responsive transcriptional repressor|nr:winged helix-turn-helix transcriptional regulator [Spirochaetales bacterium]
MPSKRKLKNTLRANILKALANLTRVCIIERLKEAPLSVNELSAKIGESSSIISRHLSVLKNAGLIQDVKQGTTVVYSLTTDRIPDILNSVDEVIKLNYERYKSFFE